MHMLLQQNYKRDIFRLDLVLSCDMQFEKYPHDTQTCSIQMESRKECTRVV